MTKESQQTREEREAARQAEAMRALERVERESETIANSNFARASNRQINHMEEALDRTLKRLGTDEDGKYDPIEAWGAGIGRIGGAIFAIILVIWLISHFTR